MDRKTRVVVVCALLCVAAACTSRPTHGPHVPIRADLMERSSSLVALGRFDTNRDGIIHREEVEGVLKGDFEAADVNKNAWLDAKELAAENDRRWKAAGPAASPVIDWNQDGQVDNQEFGATPRSLFAQFDRDENGVLDKDELEQPVLPKNTGRTRAGGN